MKRLGVPVIPSLYMQFPAVRVPRTLITCSHQLSALTTLCSFSLSAPTCSQKTPALGILVPCGIPILQNPPFLLGFAPMALMQPLDRYHRLHDGLPKD